MLLISIDWVSMIITMVDLSLDSILIRNFDDLLWIEKQKAKSANWMIGLGRLLNGRLDIILKGWMILGVDFDCLSVKWSMVIVLVWTLKTKPFLMFLFSLIWLKSMIWERKQMMCSWKSILINWVVRSMLIIDLEDVVRKFNFCEFDFVILGLLGVDIAKDIWESMLMIWFRMYICISNRNLGVRIVNWSIWLMVST